ncbi:MAG: hypothetical protein WC989_07400 [Micavibrio sp.]
MITAHPLIQWIDLLWFPLAFTVSERGKRLLTWFFIAGCVLLPRFQAELLTQIGFPDGVFGLLSSPVFLRGIVVYGFFIALFLLLAYHSKGTDKSIHLAASISLMLFAFCVSTLIMVL